jgi:hypothetical protein
MILVKTITIQKCMNSEFLIRELTRNCSFFSCQYASWEFDGEVINPSCVVLEVWSEVNRSDNFPLPAFIIKNPKP